MATKKLSVNEKWSNEYDVYRLSCAKKKKKLPNVYKESGFVIIYFNQFINNQLLNQSSLILLIKLWNISELDISISNLHIWLTIIAKVL